MHRRLSAATTPDALPAPRSGTEAKTLRNRLLALLYLLLVLPVTACIGWRNPPFQAADEGSHFLRAMQVAHGGLLASRSAAGLIGGRVPAGAVQLTHDFQDLQFQRHVTLDPRRYADAALVPAGPAVEASFANTAIYPPVFYAPAALGILAGEAAGQGPLAELRLARLSTACAASLLAALAIAITTAGALPLFWLLSLPMTLSLFGSCSQDAMLIACAALSAAALTRLGPMPARQQAFGFGAWILVAAGVGCLGAAKLPYLLLAPIPAVWAASGAHRPGCVRLLLLLSLPMAIGLGWLVVGALPVLAPSDAGRQMAWLAAHPMRIPGIAALTLQMRGVTLVREFIGVLGWLDVKLPGAFYVPCLLVLAVALAMERWRAAPAWLPGATLAMILASCAAVFAALYLDWTKVGAAWVDGVQGRYFLPPACFLILLLRPRSANPRAAALCVGWAVLGGVVTIVAITRHYTPVW